MRVRSEELRAKSYSFFTKKHAIGIITMKKIIFNSPVIISFTVISLFATLLGILTGGVSDALLFSVYRAPLTDPLTYIRFVGHVFGHVDLDHLLGNTMLLLLTGPLLEEKYGSKDTAFIILCTAVITGILQYIFFDTALLGASGVVFAFILLSSITGFKGEGVPITFILVAVLYLGQELFNAVFSFDNVSQFAHIIGGIIGAVIGFSYAKVKRKTTISNDAMEL